MDGCGDDLEAAQLVAGHESSYFTKIICKIKFGGRKKISLDGKAQHLELVIGFFNRFPYLARGLFVLSAQLTAQWQFCTLCKCDREKYIVQIYMT